LAAKNTAGQRSRTYSVEVSDRNWRRTSSTTASSPAPAASMNALIDSTTTRMSSHTARNACSSTSVLAR
jgi:hypothetical protein